MPTNQTITHLKHTMKSIKYLVCAVALIIASAVVGRANTLYFDFGVTNTASLTAGNYNNVTYPFTPGSTVSPAAIAGVTNAIDSLGSATTVTLTANLGAGSTNFVGMNTGGTAAPTGAAAAFASTATSDFFYGSGSQVAALSMTGLDGSGNTSYTFTFFGSRSSVTDNRETKYQVVGATSGVGYLNTSTNTSIVCTITGIIPDASGKVTINVGKGPNNNNASGFFYLNTMMLQSSTIQDFEGFADSAALNALGLNPTVNANVTLGATDGVNGGKALLLQGTNTVSPFYTTITLPVSSFSLTNVQSVNVAVKSISGTSENLIIKLLSSSSVTLNQGPEILTGTLPTSGFTNYTIPITNSSTAVAKIQISYSVVSYSGTTKVAFDNIALVMNKVTPIVQTNATASTITYGQTLASSTLTGGTFTNVAGQAVVMASTNFVTPTLAPNAGTTNVQVYYVPVNSVDYSNPTNTVTVTVNTNTPVLTLVASSIPYGQTLASSSLSVSVATNSFNNAQVAGTFAFTTPSLTPSNIGTTNVSVTFTPTDTTNYYSVTSTVAVLVNGGVTPTLTSLPTPSDISYGQTLASSTLTGGAATNASGGVAVSGTFAFTTPSIAPNAGSTNVSVTFTPSDINYAPVTTNVTVIVAKTTPVLTAPTAGTVGLGWPLSSTTLSGGAATNSFKNGSVSGSFAFTTPSIKPGLGATNVSVTFTPADTANYNNANTTVTVNVTSGSIVVYGSSVAKGCGSSGWTAQIFINGSASNGYAADLTTNLAPKGYYVTNNSLPGDNSPGGIARFGTNVPPVNPNYVLLGYALGNDNLAGSSDPATTVSTFGTNLLTMISMCRTNGYYPVTILCYSRNVIEAANRASYFEAMNLTINSWNLPSLNIDGAMNDGNGGLISGIDSGDGVHPNDYGHLEMFYTIPPTLFDAIGLGKTNSPYLSSVTNFARLTQNGSVTAPITFTPTNTIHSFTMSFRVRSTNNGTIAAIHTGSSYATLQITNGQFVYVSPGGSSIIASSINATNGDWHDIALSSRYTLTNTWLFVDGDQVGGSLTEQYAPDQFILGGPAASGAPATPATVDFQDWCVYRSAWNSLEAQAQAQGSLQQASMEIGAMLDDASFTSNSPALNRAQSLSVALVNTPNLTAMQSITPPGNLSAQSLSGTAAQLTWTRNSTTESGFVIERRVTGSTTWSYVATVPAATISYTNSGLTLGVSYDYRVAAQEGGLTGNYSNTATVTAGIGVHQTILVDFGPNDGSNGVVTVSPDYLGQYWNNLAGVSGSGNSLGLANLITTANGATTIGLTSGSSGWTCNGILNGGLLAPSYSLLGNFAVATATEDYFFTGNTATPASLTITNLDSTANYRLRLFASRVQPSATNDIRISRYIVTGANGPFTNDLQTTGYGIGAGGYNGNNSNIVSVLGVVPNVSNQIQVGVLSVGSTVNAYLGIMEIMANHSPVAQPISLTTGVGQNLSVDVINGANAPTDADGDGTTVTAVSGILSGSGLVATNGGTGFTYTASTAGTNTFGYTVTDTFGGIGTNLVTVVVTNTGKATPTATLSVNNSPVTYNGLAQAAMVVTNSSSVPGTVANVRYNGSATVPTAAGTYTVTADFVPDDSTNYNNLAAVAAGNFVINQAGASFTVTPYSVAYDGNPHTASVTTISGVNGENGATVGTVDVSGTTHTAPGTYNGDPWTFTSANYTNTSGTVNDAIGKATPVLNLVNYSIIQDFEGYADSAALNALITQSTANASVTLGATSGVNGSKAMILQGTNVVSPYYTSIKLPVSSFSLTNVVSVTVAVKSISGTAENLIITLLDAYNVPIDQGPAISTGTIPSTGFTNYTIPITNSSSRVAGILFSYSVLSYSGTTTVAFDNISVGVPGLTSTMTYNGTAQAAVVNSSVGGTVSNVQYNGSATVPTAAGTYSITADFVPNDSTNYSNLAGASAGTFVINQASASFTVTPYSVTYDGNPHTATVSTITGVNGETGATVGTVDVSGTTHTAAGTYNGDAWAFTGANYTNASSTVNDAIGKATPVLSLANSRTIQDFEGFADTAALNAAIVYPVNSAVTLGATSGVNGGKALIFQGTNAINPWYSVIHLPVSSLSLTNGQSVTVAVKLISGSSENLLIQLLDSYYNVVDQGPVISTHSISNASYMLYTIPITNSSVAIANIRVAYQPVDYGTTTVALDNISVVTPVTYNGTAQAAVVNSSVGGTVSNVQYNGSATVPTAVGSYSITADFAPSDNTNYNNLTGALVGNFTINQATASVTANPQTKNYGDVNPALTATVVGAVNGDILNYTLATDATQFSSVGVSNITVTLGGNPNYSVSVTNSTLTISAKAASVTANNAGKNYGQTLTFMGTEFTSSGFVGGDTVTSVILTSSGATNTANVGTYPIVASAATGTGLGNYTISYTNGTLTVNAATPVTVNSPVRLPDGNFQLIFTGGDPGVSYVIEASDDLSNPVWSSLITNTATLSGIPSFIDLSATNNPVRFYRTVIP